MRRVVVVGGPGAGKSRTASRVAEILGAPHVEMDALWWEPGWSPADPETFREIISQLSDGGAWVMDGNYLDEVGREIVWPRADTLLWLDVPGRVAVSRVLRRSVVRVATRALLWGTNRQGLSTLSPRSIARLIRRWPAYSLDIERVLAAQAFPHLTVVRLRSDADVEAWLVHAIEGQLRAGGIPPEGPGT